MGCAQTSVVADDRNRVAPHSQYETDVARGLADVASATGRSSKNEAILMLKSKNTVQIKRCEPAHVLNSFEDCKEKSGSSAARISRAEFKRRWKAALDGPVELPVSRGKKVDLKSKNKLVSDIDAERGRVLIQSSIHRIRSFLEKFENTAAAEIEGYNKNSPAF